LDDINQLHSVKVKAK